MKRFFADTFYWIALANPRDEFHKRAGALSRELEPFRLVTTDEVLSEFLTMFGNKGPYLRAKAVELVQRIMNDPNIRVVPQTRNSFISGLDLYRERPDKPYSLADCISMVTMRNEDIRDVLTADKHFEQEDFNVLFEQDSR